MICDGHSTFQAGTMTWFWWRSPVPTKIAREPLPVRRLRFERRLALDSWKVVTVAR